MDTTETTGSVRLLQQMQFLREIDALKTILRRTRISDGSRRENTAEHSWHLGLLAMWLSEWAPEPIDTGRAVRMALIHDIVEIDAGDTFVFGTQGHDDKEEREQRAARRIFAILPDDQRDELWGLWNEFEAAKTAEAKYVRVLDRLQPLLLHDLTDGTVWEQHGVRESQVEERVAEIRDNAPQLWPYAEAIIQRLLDRGKLIRG